MSLQSAIVQVDSTKVTLEESTPHYGWRSYWMTVLLLQILALVLASPLVLAATWPRADQAFIGFIGTAICTFPFCLIFAWTQQGYYSKRSAQVWYQDGTVNCVADSKINTAELSQCRWWYGNQTQATHPPREHLLGGKSAILVEFPLEFETEERMANHRRYPAGPLVVAVGLIPQTFQKWERLLLEADAVHDQERQALPAPLSGQATAYLAIPALLGGGFLCFYGTRALGNLLTGAGVPQDIAFAIALPLFFPGCVYLLAYFALSVSLHERRCALTVEQGRAAVEDWKYESRWLGVLAFMLFSIWISDRWTLTCKVIVSVVNLLLTGSIILHLRYLLEDPRDTSAD